MYRVLSNADDVTLRGSLYERNLMLRFQLGTSAIVERWGIFDSGVYSTTWADAQRASWRFAVQTASPLRRLYVQIQRDKRIATEVLYHVGSTPTLRCYRVTSNDSKASDFGHEKILELKLREDQFSPSKDNAELFDLRLYRDYGSGRYERRWMGVMPNLSELNEYKKTLVKAIVSDRDCVDLIVGASGTALPRQVVNRRRGKH